MRNWHILRKGVLLSILNLLFFIGHAQVPAEYYSGAEDKTGEELKTALYNIIKGHIEFPYSSSSTDVWDILKETDRDPTNANNVIGLYSNFSMDAEAEYNGGDGWNREHVWAQSRGNLGTSPGPGTDVHHLRASDISTNSARSNRTFAEATVQYIDNSGTYSGATQSYTSTSEFVWEPREEVKGDVARMIFYMATRYEGLNGEPDLELVDYVLSNTDKSPVHGKLTDLLSWHNADPVDDLERQRNDIIYSYQKNRNPYIDHPEYVTLIWSNSVVTDISNQEIFEDITVYPNPFSSSAIIKLKSTGHTEILVLIYSSEGSLLKSKSHAIISGETQIELGANLTTGLYLIQAIINGQSKSFKLIKE